MKNNEASRLDALITRAFREYDMSFKKVLVGFSGGADSVTLLDILHKKYGDNVCAMHVNHMLRGEDADADENFCKSFCNKRGIKFFSVHVDVMSECGGAALEETARRMRYNALISCAKSINADAIALAHTQSDNAETVIFNICRGCGISGLGIPPVRSTEGIHIIRPLIFATRGDIIDHINKNELAFVTDMTNFDKKYSRNFIRGDIIPALTHVNPEAVQNLSGLSERARADEEFIDGFAEDFIKKNDMSISSLRSLHRAVLTRVIMKATSFFEKTPSSAHIDAIISLISDGENGAKTELPGSMLAIIADKKLYFLKKSEYDAINTVKARSSSLDDMGFFIGEANADPDERIYFAYVPKSAVHLLYAKARQSGDKYRFGNMTREIKKLKSSVPLDARVRRPVLKMGNKIVWYPSFPVCDEFSSSNEEKIKIYYKEKIILR